MWSPRIRRTSSRTSTQPRKLRVDVAESRPYRRRPERSVMAEVQTTVVTSLTKKLIVLSSFFVGAAVLALLSDQREYSSLVASGVPTLVILTLEAWEHSSKTRVQRAKAILDGDQYG